jgi:biopolymer transport protein ExbD
VSLSPVELGGESGDEGDLVAEINVTPLTDIFLVLLIIFMVTSTALTQQGTKVNLPRAGAGGAEPSGVVVTATADHRVEVNGAAVSMEGLRPALEAALQKSAEHSIILQGDRNVVLEQAVQIMTVAKEAGAEHIAIATAPPEAAKGK